jgi:tetratricopeptide (TPR) repeat protein
MVRRNGTAAGAPEGERKLVRAHRFVQEGDTARALMLFRDIINGGDPRDLAQACVGAGNAYLAMTRYPLAESCYQQAVDAGAGGDLLAEALQNLGIVRYVRGDRAGACELMTELAMLDHPVFSPLAEDNLQVLFGIAVS